MHYFRAVALLAQHAPNGPVTTKEGEVIVIFLILLAAAALLSLILSRN